MPNLKSSFLKELTRKNLALNKKRTVMTVIGILLSSALIVCVSSLVTSVYQTIYSAAVSQSGNYHLRSEQPQYFEQIKQSAGGYNFHRVNVLGYTEAEGDDGEEKRYARVVAIDNFQASGLKLLEGRFPEKKGEILITKRYLREMGLDYKAGGELELDFGQLDSGADRFEDGDLIRGKSAFRLTEKKKYTVVGLVRRGTEVMEGYFDNIHSFATVISSEDKPLKEELCFLVNNPKEAHKYINDFRKQNSEAKFSTNNTLLMAADMGSDGKGVITMAAAVVVGIIMITSVFVIRNSFSISITEKTKQYGVLKSLGATNRQIRKNVIYEGMILGVVGTVLGVILGIVAAGILIWVVNYLLIDSVAGLVEPDTRLEFGLSALGVGVAVVLSLMTVYLATLRIARRAKKLSPIEAIRSQRDVNIRNKDVRTLRLFNKIMGISGIIAYKNLRRSRKKYRTTVMSLTVSVAVFIAIYGFVQILNDTVKISFREMNYNVVGFYAEQGGEVSKIRGEAKGLAEKIFPKERYTILSAGSVRLEIESLSEEYAKKLRTNEESSVRARYNVIDRRSFDLTLKENGLPENTKMVAVNRMLEKEKGKTRRLAIYKGNKIKYRVAKEKEGGVNADQVKEVEFKAIEKPPVGFFADLYTGQLDLIVPETDFDQEVKLLNNGIMLKTERDIEIVKAVREELKATKNKVWQFQNFSELARLVNNLILIVQIFGYGFILVITLIGLTNVFNAINTNMTLRQSDFATLKSIGMTKREFRRMIGLESLMYGMKALLFGLPIGVGLSMLIHRIIVQEKEIEYGFPWVAIVISTAVLLLIVRVIMGYSVKKIESKNLVEVIRNENI